MSDELKRCQTFCWQGRDDADFEIRFDFEDDWHCMVEIKKGASRKKIAAQLQGLVDMLNAKEAMAEGEARVGEILPQWQEFQDDFEQALHNFETTLRKLRYGECFRIQARWVKQRGAGLDTRSFLELLKERVGAGFCYQMDMMTDDCIVARLV